MSDQKFEEFRQRFVTEAEADRAVMGEGLRKSFVAKMSAEIADEEAENISLVYLDERFAGRRVSVDGYALNSEERTLLLVAADWNEFDRTNALTRTEAEAILRRVRAFYEFAKTGRLQDPAIGILEWSTPEYELAELIRTEAIDRVRILLYTDRMLSGKLKRLGNEPIDGIPVSEEVWGLERLYEFYRSSLDHEPLELSFADRPIPLTLATKGAGFRSYLGVVSAEKLAAVYQEHGGRLLEGNVRSYLTLKSSVNRDIRGTILSDPEHFFIFNNGIAATATNLKFNDRRELVEATDFQIINGGQTTASLARAAHTDKADLSGISVAIKLTEISNELDEAEARALIRNISRYSNNQNKISGADFSSNHPFHVLMEQCAARIMAPPAPGMLHGSYWFYERNRGSYLQKQMFMTDAEQRAFTQRTDKKHVIKKEDLARVRLAWQQSPDVVSKGAATLFSKFMEKLDADWEEKRKSGFYGDEYFKDSVALVILYNDLRAAVMEAPWYDRGYLANIVAYGMSVFSWLFEKKFLKAHFNFEEIWKRQEAPGYLLSLLIPICEEVKKCLTAPTRSKENVTEWAKLEKCWLDMKARFEALEWSLPDDAAQWRRSAEEEKRAQNEARDQAKIDDSVDLMTQAMQYPHWREALEFNAGQGHLNAMQERAVKRCWMIPKVVPSDRELKAAFAGLAVLRQEGFRY